VGFYPIGRRFESCRGHSQTYIGEAMSELQPKYQYTIRKSAFADYKISVTRLIRNNFTIPHIVHGYAMTRWGATRVVAKLISELELEEQGIDPHLVKRGVV
jgi:hypothetical protein